MCVCIDAFDTDTCYFIPEGRLSYPISRDMIILFVG